MKKFQFAAGLLAMGMLASCQSDAPDAPNVGPNGGLEEGPTTMVAMRINTGASTRAFGGDANATAAECKINGIVVYVMDGDQTAMTLVADNIVDEATDDNAQVAFFNIGSVRKAILEGLTGKEVELKVFANVIENGHTPFGEFDSKNWTELVSWSTTNGFLMTNSDEAKGELQPSTNTVNKEINGTQTNVWLLNSKEDGTNTVNVTLTRLATRFDVEEVDQASAPNYKGNNVYTSTNQSSLEITLEEVAINTHEKGTYWFQQDADAAGMTPGAARNFYTFNGTVTVPNVTPAKTFNYQSDDCRKLLSNQTWKTKNNGSFYGTYYARPHYVSELPEGENNYQRASYVAYKASFTDATLITAGKEYCYAYNGILLGTLDKMQGKSWNDYVTTEDEGLKAVLNLANGITSDADFQEKVADVKAVRSYKAEGGKFYTYYNRVLQHTPGEISANNTDLRRNHIYAISVKSLNGLGHDGKKIPNDPDDDDTMIWMELDVQVKDWTPNSANKDLDLSL